MKLAAVVIAAAVVWLSYRTADAYAKACGVVDRDERR